MGNIFGSSQPSSPMVLINRNHVDTCEKFWRNGCVTWKHKTVQNSKCLASVTEAKTYINGTASNWNIMDKPNGQQFINTLLLNAELSGNSSTDYVDAEYKVGGTDGTATYIYVIVANQNGKILVAFSYHHLTESLTNGYVYTQYAEQITIDWLKWKACETLQGILSANLAPRIQWK